MAVITERLFTGGYAGNDRGISLRSEEFIRPMSIGNNWTKLRIAMLYGTENSGTIAGTLDVGLCTNGDRGIGSGNPINYLGVGIGGGTVGRTTGQSLTTVAVTGGWLGTCGRRYGTAQQGAVVSGYVSSGPDFLNFTQAGNGVPNGGVYRRGLGLFDFNRVSATAANAYWHSLNSSNIPYTQSDFGIDTLITAAEESFALAQIVANAYNLQTLAFNNINLLTDAGNFEPAGYGQITYSSVAGPLDAVNIAWSSSVAACTIWAISVTRFA